MPHIPLEASLFCGCFHQEPDRHDRDYCTHNPSGAVVVSPTPEAMSRMPNSIAGALHLLRTAEGNKLNRGPSKKTPHSNPGT